MPAHPTPFAAVFCLMAAWAVAAAAGPSRDVVLVMDNSGSMDRVAVVDGIPRYCQAPELEPSDPECISGDPDQLRGPLLRSLVDSLVGFGGCGIAVILFSERVESSHDSLVLLDASTRDSLKARLIMDAEGQTNYTAALRAAMQLLSGSTKPRSHQALVFLSDGRPNLPYPLDGGPYLYKSFWDSLPPVHGLFMEGNPANSRDLLDLAAKTGGSFHTFGSGRSMDSLLSLGILPRLRDSASVSLPAARRGSLPDIPAWRPGFLHPHDALGRLLRRAD